jgi:HTH-type transcriptional repressor of NAD biosynthesis genes
VGQQNKAQPTFLTVRIGFNMYINGFVFGKFYPFHNGHVALINFGAEQCQHLTVVVCACASESITLAQRLAWIRQHYVHNPQIEIIGLPYDETLLPNTSVSSRAVSALWAKAFKALLPNVQVLFSSEPYGDFVAQAMGIKHGMFDQQREKVTISATAIRQYPLRYWHFLPLSVRPYYVQKVVLLGTESSGKSTLAQLLAQYFETNYVAESGREIVPHTNECRPEHLQQIAQAHAEAINNALPFANKILFIDTDVHITASYSLYLFGQELTISPPIAAANKAQLYLYLDNDVPFVQDGTRLSEAARNALHEHHLAVLAAHSIAFRRISGNWQMRLEKAIGLVRELLANT